MGTNAQKCLQDLISTLYLSYYLLLLLIQGPVMLQLTSKTPIKFNESAIDLQWYVLYNKVDPAQGEAVFKEASRNTELKRRCLS